MTLSKKVVESENLTKHYLYRKYMAAKKENLVVVASHVLRLQKKPATFATLRTQTKDQLAMVVAESDMAALKSKNHEELLRQRVPLFAA